MGVSLLLLNLPPLKFSYGIIRILVVGDVVIRAYSYQVSGGESRDKWYGVGAACTTHLICFSTCVHQFVYIRAYIYH